MTLDLSAYEKKYKVTLETYPLEVKLLGYIKNPYDLAAASARTCYSSKGIILPEDVSKSEKSRELRDKISKSTLKAGHMTTRQHAHFVFGIKGISRNLIWQFLHSHPYYNSEQVSQRYVSIKQEADWFSLPKSLKIKEIFDWHEKTHNIYKDLIKIIKPAAADIYFSIHKLKSRNRDKYEGEIEKKAMEAARYVMPISTTAYLYHTVNALTLHRYVKMMTQTSHDESIALVLKMLREVKKIDPMLVEEMADPMPPKVYPASVENAFIANQEFDFKLAKGNVASLSLKNETQYESILQLGYSLLTGNNKVSTSEIFKHLLNGRFNLNVTDVLYTATLDPVSRLLNHIHFTFQKKLSHTADSQEQRHRTLPGSRPLLYLQMSLKPDYIVPQIIKENIKARALYEGFMHENFHLIEKLYEKEIPLPELTYLLPNAYPVRFLESGDLLNFLHKWKARLCYNAQEEIFYSTVDEVKQVFKQMPDLIDYIGPPCFMRDKAEQKPRCPEGDRFCGTKVWRLNIKDYERII
ncbi:MAG: FAD-dependent thymidylate synthase [Spirochaetia bacterium]|nr:FAD-dependent thymidylate synthase [Spirochaetia bacterium]